MSFMDDLLIPLTMCERANYVEDDLSPKRFIIKGNNADECCRHDFIVVNKYNLSLKCSLFAPADINFLNNKYPCVIVAHGDGGCRLDSQDFIPILLSQKICLSCFDFSGCGLSEGVYMTLGQHEQYDLECVVNHLMLNYGFKRIGLYGRSMGAVSCLLYVSRICVCRNLNKGGGVEEEEELDQGIFPRDGNEETNIGKSMVMHNMEIYDALKGMILDSAFASLNEVIDGLAQDLKVPCICCVVPIIKYFIKKRVYKKSGLKIDKLTTVQAAHECNIPCIVAHSMEDTIVGFDQAQRIFDAYKSRNKEMQLLHGDHNSERDEAFYSKFVLFFRNAFECDDKKNIFKQPPLCGNEITVVEGSSSSGTNNSSSNSSNNNSSSSISNTSVIKSTDIMNYENKFDETNILESPLYGRGSSQSPLLPPNTDPPSSLFSFNPTNSPTFPFPISPSLMGNTISRHYPSE